MVSRKAKRNRQRTRVGNHWGIGPTARDQRRNRPHDRLAKEQLNEALTKIDESLGDGKEKIIMVARDAMRLSKTIFHDTRVRKSDSLVALLERVADAVQKAGEKAFGKAFEKPGAMED